MDFTKFVIDNNYGEVITDSSFKYICSIGTGGGIKYLYLPNSIDSLCQVFRFINFYNFKYIVIGNGSNILPSDELYDGIVIMFSSLENFLIVNEENIECSAFYSAMKLSSDLAKMHIGDLSFMCGIPGLIGGLIVQNSGAYNDEIKNHIISVKYINSFGDIVSINKEDMNLGYRDSIFKHIKGIVISARFNINKNISTMDKIISRNKSRRLTQPLEYKNMGSVFKNLDDILAWEVIDKLDIRGLSCNGAMVSDKHCNFIINLDNAKSCDILFLINKIKQEAKDKLNILLVPEVIIL